MTELYLVVTPATAPAKLTEALDTGAIAAVLLRDPTEAAIAALRLPVQRRNVAFLIANDIRLAVATRCDGVHLDDPEDAAAARRALGDLQLGVSCGLSRDAAMRAGEDGADYVSFGPPCAEAEELIAWWSDLMELPAVAEGATAENYAALVRAGADFLAVGGVDASGIGALAEGVKNVLF